jgi:nucleotide-binding universal stress UspA family protein
MSSGNSASNRTSVPKVHSRNLSAADAPAGNVTSLEIARQEFARKKYRVLLAHDLTGSSEIALVRAARLTLEREGHLTILHVVDSELPAPVIEARRAQAQSCLETEVCRWLGSRKLSYRIDIGIGDPAGAIAARAQGHDVDLVVTGRNQRRAVANRFTTTVRHLLRQAQRPVLVVGNSNQSPYQRVLIPIDFTDASAARVRFAAAFLPQARLHLLHAYKRRFQDYIAAPSLTFGPEEERGKISGPERDDCSLSHHTALSFCLARGLFRKPAPTLQDRAPVERQRKQALSWLIEASGLGERRPVVTIEGGDALALVRQELARQKTDLLVMGAHARSATEHTSISSAGGGAVGWRSPCDVLFLSLYDLPDRSIVSSRAMSCE